jgi:hypothetical protein
MHTYYIRTHTHTYSHTHILPHTHTHTLILTHTHTHTHTQEVVELAKLMLSRDHGGAKLERSWGPGDGRPVEELKVACDQLLQEYLLSSDVGEAVRCIAELKSPFFFHEIIKRTVSNAMDKSDTQQLLMSALMEKLHTGGLLSAQQALKGFNRLYTILPDLVLDTPSARSILDGFTDRARGTVLPEDYEAPEAPKTDMPAM